MEDRGPLLGPRGETRAAARERAEPDAVQVRRGRQPAGASLSRCAGATDPRVCGGLRRRSTERTGSSTAGASASRRSRCRRRPAGIRVGATRAAASDSGALAQAVARSRPTYSSASAPRAVATSRIAGRSAGSLASERRMRRSRPIGMRRIQDGRDGRRSM